MIGMVVVMVVVVMGVGVVVLVGVGGVGGCICVRIGRRLRGRGGAVGGRLHLGQVGSRCGGGGPDVKLMRMVRAVVGVQHCRRALGLGG